MRRILPLGLSLPLLMLLVCPLAADVVSGILHTSPRPVTVSGLKNNMGETTGVVVGVACVGRSRNDAGPCEVPPDYRQYNFVAHLNTDCDMQDVPSHAASYRVRCTAGPDPTQFKTVTIWVDTRLYDDTSFVESQAGGKLLDDLAFATEFAHVDQAFEKHWSPDPPLQ